MSPDLVDSNVLLDVATRDPRWGEWSAEQLSRHAPRSRCAFYRTLTPPHP